jgi:four helix bundle protein
MQDFKKLLAWQKSHSMVRRVYLISAKFPKAELFGLTSQIRRASVSVPSNIAEGACRGGKSFAHFLRISLGSAGELEYLLILVADLDYISASESDALQEQVVEAKRLITGLLKSVKSSNGKNKPRTNTDKRTDN